MTIKDLTQRASRAGVELERKEIAAALGALLDEGIAVEERAAFLRALHERGVTGGELAGFAEELLERAVEVPRVPSGAIDVCGTGGDRAGTFNVSTAVMFVAAGAGAIVAKHGNRGITSKCGGADVLEALGVDTGLSPAAAADQLNEVGCTFFFAPLYHPAVKAVAPVRKFLADSQIPTIFNLLGPLINPARPDFQLVGLYDPTMLGVYAEALRTLGRKRAWAVHGTGPNGFRLDEMSVCGPTWIAEAGGAQRKEISASAFDVPLADPADLAGGDAQANARLIRAILAGEERGPKRDIVRLNAAAALALCGIATGIADGLEKAAQSLDSGAAWRKLESLRGQGGEGL